MTNKETLEEAANKYVEDFDLSFYDTVEAIPVKELGKKDFIEGAKWQAERMYSEEDILDAWELGAKEGLPLTRKKKEELFKQFKKK